MHHVAYIPAAYAAIIYAALSGCGLLLALIVGLRIHHKMLLTTHCENWEFFPSISTVTGDGMPERQIWRMTLILCVSFRMGSTISLFSVMWRHGTKGMSEIMRSSSPLAAMRSSSFLSLGFLFADLWRLTGAAGWTLISSGEDLPRHNIAFGIYMVAGLVLQVVLVIFVRRNLHNTAIYSSPQKAYKSLWLKKIGLIGQTSCALGVVAFYTRHVITCANGSFSLANMCEWMFAAFNIFFDATACLELEMEGWWFGPSLAITRRARAWTENSTTPRATVGMEDGATVTIFPPGTTGVSAATEANADSDTRIVVHHFTFWCCPAKVTMWLVDTYWSYMLFAMMVHLVQHMYFMPLVKMSVSFDVLVTFFVASPVLLRISPLRKILMGPAPLAHSLLRPSNPPVGAVHRVAPLYVTFYAMAALSHMQFNIVEDANWKLIASSVGPFFLSLATFTRFLYPSTGMQAASPYNEDPDESRRLAITLPLGFVLSMLLRILYISQDPVFGNATYNAVFGIALGLVMTTIIFRHALFCVYHPGSAAAAPPSQLGVGGTESKEARSTEGATLGGPSGAEVTNTYVQIVKSYPPPSGPYLALLFGVFCSAVTFYFTGANVIPRLVAVDPYPASLLIVAAFVVGICYSADFFPLHPAMAARHAHSSKRRLSLWSLRDVIELVVQGSHVRFGALYLGSALVLFFATRQTNRSYELSNPYYPVREESARENVLLKYWAVEEDFFGNKYVAFAGGVLMSACFGALSPIVVEIVWAHQRIRRLLRVTEHSESGVLAYEESRVLTSFELLWFVVYLVCAVCHALSTSYPFAPMGWLFREHSVLFQFTNLALVYLLVWRIARQIRCGRGAADAKRHQPIIGKDELGGGDSALSAGDVTPRTVPRDHAADGSAAGALMRSQRSMHAMIGWCVLLAFLTAIIGRAVCAPPDQSVALGNVAAAQYPQKVQLVHETLAELYKENTRRTTDELKDFEKDYWSKTYESQLEKLHKAAVSNDTETNVFGLANLPIETRKAIWDAGRGMTFLSGMIWTVHFALDNNNVDDLERMVQQAVLTDTGVIGLLESDSAHLVNGNRDMVEYLAYYLGFRYTDYGPTALDNTYGCALISKFPILWVRRYVLPSPLGELACLIHAKIDLYGLVVHTYVGHFGNTHHWADGLLQSQFLGKLVQQNAGPSLFLGYLVTNPGNPERYGRYTSQSAPGMFRDTALEMYRDHKWVRLWNRGGYEEQPPPLKKYKDGEKGDFDIEWKLQSLNGLESGMSHIDQSFRRPPPGKPLRYFRFNSTGRVASAHPRFEFVDRYCQYILYKTGSTRDEPPEKAADLQPMQMYLYDWHRKLDNDTQVLSDTEIQVVRLGFRARK